MKSQMIWWRHMVSLRLVHTENIQQQNCEQECAKLIAKLRAIALTPRDMDLKEGTKIMDKLASLPCLFTDIETMRYVLFIINESGVNCATLRNKIYDSFMAIDMKAFKTSSCVLLTIAFHLYSDFAISEPVRRRIEDSWKYIPIDIIPALTDLRLSHLASISQNPGEHTKEYDAFSSILINELNKRQLSAMFFVNAVSVKASKTNQIRQLLINKFCQRFSAENLDELSARLSVMAIRRLLINASKIDSEMCKLLTALAKHKIEMTDIKDSNDMRTLAAFVIHGSVHCVPKEPILRLILDKLKKNYIRDNGMRLSQFLALLCELAPVMTFPRDELFMKIVKPHLISIITRIPFSSIATLNALHNAGYADIEFWRKVREKLENLLSFGQRKCGYTNLIDLLKICNTIGVDKKLLSTCLFHNFLPLMDKHITREKFLTIYEQAQKFADEPTLKRMVSEFRKVRPEVDLTPNDFSWLGTPRSPIRGKPSVPVLTAPVLPPVAVPAPTPAPAVVQAKTAAQAPVPAAAAKQPESTSLFFRIRKLLFRNNGPGPSSSSTADKI